VNTGIWQRAQPHMSPEQAHLIRTAQPNGRLSEPEEIAELVLWLCSDAASTINSTRIAADAGWHTADAAWPRG